MQFGLLDLLACRHVDTQGYAYGYIFLIVGSFHHVSLGRHGGAQWNKQYTLGVIWDSVSAASEGLATIISTISERADAFMEHGWIRTARNLNAHLASRVQDTGSKEAWLPPAGRHGTSWWNWSRVLVDTTRWIRTV